MLNLLKGIIDMISNFVGFVTSIIESFVNLLINIPTYLLFVQTNMRVLPNIILPFVLGSLSIYIIFLILGRNN